MAIHSHSFIALANLLVFTLFRCPPGKKIIMNASVR